MPAKCHSWRVLNRISHSLCLHSSNLAVAVAFLEHHFRWQCLYLSCCAGESISLGRYFLSTTYGAIAQSYSCCDGESTSLGRHFLSTTYGAIAQSYSCCAAESTSLGRHFLSTTYSAIAPSFTWAAVLERASTVQPAKSRRQHWLHISMGNQHSAIIRMGSTNSA